MTAKRRAIFGIGALVAVLYALWRLLETRQRESGVAWEPQPFPMPPRPRPEPAAREPAAGEPEPQSEPAVDRVDATDWVEPVDGACPTTHPVKGKLSSGIFHAPGMQMYERTRADRCYADPAAAEADGLRASKR
jgi:hypothetical protein